MDLAAWRDLIIVIWGIIGILASIIVSIVIILMYKQTTTLVESAKVVVERVGDIVDYTDEQLIQPLTQLGSMIRGVAQVVNFVSRLFKRKKEEDDE
jgi:hypothetical protein